MIIIKQTPTHTVPYTWNSAINGRTYRSETVNYTYGVNRIEYEDGPRYLKVGSSKHCNWKSCEHTRDDNITGVPYHFSRHTWTTKAYTPTDSYDSWGVPVVNYWTRWGLNPSRSTPSVPASDLDALFGKVYDDMVGRTRNNLLLLEDLAGLVSGKSLFKSIAGVAHASQLLARSITNGRRLSKAFGRKASLYDMWLSSKELVRQIIGLRLGYRFSFKTALNDFALSAQFGAEFGEYLSQIRHRNNSGFLRYEKRIQEANNDEPTVYDKRSVYFNMFARSDHLRTLYVPTGHQREFEDRISPAKLCRRAGVEATAFVQARVRYPFNYGTLSHFLTSKFGLDKPLTTLWAIVPCSFLVDYLLNVQDALTYVDNKLNDYLVQTNILSAWVCCKTFREAEFSMPGMSLTYENPSWPGMFTQVNWPAIKTRWRWSEHFVRYPISASRIHAQFPPIIGASSSNWVNSVGTGLELLSQTRLR